MKNHQIIFIFLILITVFHSPLSYSQSQQRFFPKENWEIDKCNSIKGIRPFIIDSMNTTGLVIVHAGKIVFSYGDIEELSYVASCRKSILAMLFGKYIDNGLIDLQKTMEELEIDDIQGLLPNEKNSTIEHVLTARSGVYHPSSYPGDDLAFAPERGTQKPGTYFLYNNWDFNVAGAAFEKLTQINLYDALEKDLAHPIHMQDFNRVIQKKTGNMASSKYPAYPMFLSCRDMARLGYLMMNKGNWDGVQIIPKWWVDKMTSLVTNNQSMNPLRLRNSDFGYGYLWWIFDKINLRDELKGAYTAQGLYGQYITVIPKLDLVIAHKTNALFQRHTNNYEQLLNLILENAGGLQQPKESADNLENYIGEFSNGHITMGISRNNSGLRINSPLGKLKLIPCDKYNFSFEEEDRFRLIFTFDESGKVKSFSLTPDTLGLGVFEKKE